MILNNFHRFQNFRQLFNLFSANLIEKATHVTLLWNLSRNPDKISSKIRSKHAKFKEDNEQIGNSLSIHEKNVDDFWLNF